MLCSDYVARYNREMLKGISRNQESRKSIVMKMMYIVHVAMQYKNMGGSHSCTESADKMFNSEWMHVLVYQLHGVINRVIFFEVVFPIKWLVLPVTSSVVPPCWCSVSSWGSVWD